MHSPIRLVIISVLSLTVLTGWGFKKDSPAEQRAEIDQATQQVLDDLFREEPGARNYLDRSAGYAVFSSLGINVLLLSTARGKGIAHFKDSGRRVYMKMYSAGAGVGMGVKDYRLVFLFEDEAALREFVEDGWTAGAQADAAAAHHQEGDAASLAMDVSPGVKLYQLTESGLALQATIQGTKYLKDDDLN